MTDNSAKLKTSALRAKAIYDRLMALPRPEGMSNNEWAKKAMVNTSFFTNVRNGSEPSVGNLQAVLRAVDVTLPEFFLHDAKGRLVARPTQAELEAAIRAVLPGLPKDQDRQAEYLAEAVGAVLELQQTPESNIVDVGFLWRGGSKEDGEAHGSTTTAESSLPRTG
jgi:hypothetical protein